MIFLTPIELRVSIFWAASIWKLYSFPDLLAGSPVHISEGPRIEKETWHSYEGDGKNDRVALIYNLNTKNLREVYKIEKKKYYRAMLRWKIKPYLYDYFKINI